jgi:hypothetical protein
VENVTEVEENTVVELTPSEQIAQIVNAESVEESTALSITGSFESFVTQANDWSAKAKALVVTDISQTAEMKQAKESRLALRRIRINMEEKHKELKADSLSRGRALDGVKRFIKGKIEPLESHLKEQEEFADRYLEEMRQKKIVERTQSLANETDMDSSMLNLGAMTDEQFDVTLQQGKDARAGRIKREQEAEAERLAEIKAEQDKREAIEKENVRLKAEADEKDRKVEAERIEREAKEKAEREAREKQEAEAEDKRAKAEEARLKIQADAAAAAEKKHRVVLSRQIAMREVDDITNYDELAEMSVEDFDARLQFAKEAADRAIEEREVERKREQAEFARKEAENIAADKVRRDKEAKEKADLEAKLEAEAKEKAKMQAQIDKAAAERKAQEDADAERSAASISNAAEHTANMVIETAQKWASRHPRTKDGQARFMESVIAKLTDSLEEKEDSE